MEQWRIGQLAREQGINPKTIRYYEEIGLLPRARRTARGYRVYEEADRERLRFIRKAQGVGLTLVEIREILAARGHGDQPCRHVLELIEQKVAAVDRQIRALSEFREELVILQQEARETMRQEACVCGIIEQHKPQQREFPRVAILSHKR